MRQPLNINEFIAEFKQTLLFKHLTHDEIQYLVSNSTVVNSYEGEYLVNEGDAPTHLLFIMEGSVITYRTNSEGDEVSIRLLGKGGSCMDAVIFMGGASPIGVRSADGAKILKIPIHIIKKTIEKNINFANNIIDTLANYYRESIFHIENLTIKDSKTRLGYYLLKAYLESHTPHPYFHLNFKKSVIASFLGIKPETLSRLFKELQKEQLISIRGADIELTQATSLCQFCDANTKNICDKPHKKDCKN